MSERKCERICDQLIMRMERLEGPIERVICTLEEYIAKYPNHELHLDENSDYDDNWTNLLGYRDETDAEYELCMSKAKKKTELQLKKAEAKREKDRATYEKLKKQFEGGG